MLHYIALDEIYIINPKCSLSKHFYCYFMFADRKYYTNLYIDISWVANGVVWAAEREMSERQVIGAAWVEKKRIWKRIKVRERERGEIEKEN